jgi:hypothetical protein
MGGGYSSDELKEELLALEKWRRKILEAREEEWHLKIWALWLEKGDDNTKFFQAYAKGRKMDNTIWSLKDSEGRKVSSFDGMARIGKEYFHSLFKADQRASMADIVRMALYFPRFVGEDENKSLFEEVTEDELKEVLHSFQKVKIPGPDGWTIEFFIGLYELIGTNILRVVEESRSEGPHACPFQLHLHCTHPKIR